MTPEQLEKRLRRAEKTICSTRKYKIYTALLTQSGVNNGPDVTVLENGIGNIVWTYQTYGAFGRYVGTLTGAFPADQTWVAIISNNSDILFEIYRLSDNEIVVGTQGAFGGGYTDDALLNTPIEIRVYRCNGTTIPGTENTTTTTTTTTTSTTTTTTLS